MRTTESRQAQERARQLDLFSARVAVPPRGRRPSPVNDNRPSLPALIKPRPLTRVEVERAAELDRMLALRSALRRAMEKPQK